MAYIHFEPIEKDFYKVMSKIQIDGKTEENMVALKAFAFYGQSMKALTELIRLNPSIINDEVVQARVGHFLEDKEVLNGDEAYLKAMVNYASNRDEFIKKHNGLDQLEILGNISNLRKEKSALNSKINDILTHTPVGSSYKIVSDIRKNVKEVETKILNLECDCRDDELMVSLRDDLEFASELYYTQDNEDKNRECVSMAKFAMIDILNGNRNQSDIENFSKKSNIQKVWYNNEDIVYYSSILNVESYDGKKNSKGEKTLKEIASKEYTKDGKDCINEEVLYENRIKLGFNNSHSID